MTIVMERAEALVPADFQTESVSNGLDVQIVEFLDIEL
jgi:hypothetical protein